MEINRFLQTIPWIKKSIKIVLTTEGASSSVYTFSGANYESVWENLSS